jgi:trigger factor
MKYTKEIQKDKKVKFEIELTKEEWEEQLQKAYEHDKGKYDIEGFRKGKAPKSVIENKHGETVFYEHALEHAFYDHYGEILKKEKEVEPVANPSLDVKKMDKNGVTLEVVVEVKPEVTLGEYKGLKIKQNDNTISDDEVKAELMLEQDKASRLVDVDRPIKKGDTVTFDFVGKLNGEKFEGGSAENYELEIGSNKFIPGFEEQMIGLKKGDNKELKVTFPENYHAENLKGKETTFEVTVHSVKEKQLPELNDELAQNMSEFETLGEWKESVKKKLQDKKTQETKIQAENDLINKVVENSSVEAPESLVEQQIDSFIKDFEYKLMYQGMKLDDYLKMMKTTKEDLRADRREDAIKTVKTKLVLEAVIKKEKLEVTNDEFNEKLKLLSAKENKSLEEYKKELTEQKVDSLVNDLMVNKLLKLLRENNNIS